MSNAKETDREATPSCPLCKSATVLKELFPVGETIHYFFKCVSCALEYPVIGGGPGVAR
jgi:hypothetical protein